MSWTGTWYLLLGLRILYQLVCELLHSVQYLQYASYISSDETQRLLRPQARLPGQGSSDGDSWGHTGTLVAADLLYTLSHVHLKATFVSIALSFYVLSPMFLASLSCFLKKNKARLRFPSPLCARPRLLRARIFINFVLQVCFFINNLMSSCNNVAPPVRLCTQAYCCNWII